MSERILGDVSTFDPAQDALNRMRRAALRGTGCHLTAAMIESLSRTMLGETWAERDPRQHTPELTHD